MEIYMQNNMYQSLSKISNKSGKENIESYFGKYPSGTK